MTHTSRGRPPDPSPTPEPLPAVIFARAERARLSDLLGEVGPHAPTLCAGWDTTDLATHVVLRERRPDAAIGILVRPLAAWQRHVHDQLAALPYPALVDLVRQGPPPWSPFRPALVEGLVNPAEFFVHHEDVRRAAPEWQARDLPEPEERVLRVVLRRVGRMLFRRASVGVVLRRPDGVTLRVRPGEPSVTLSGPASELLLYAFGRTERALVEVAGTPEAVERFRRTPLAV